MGKLEEDVISDLLGNGESANNFNRPTSGAAASDSVTKSKVRNRGKKNRQKRKNKQKAEGTPAKLIKPTNDNEDSRASDKMTEEERAAAFLAKTGRPYMEKLTPGQRRALSRRKGRLLRREMRDGIDKQRKEAGVKALLSTEEGGESADDGNSDAGNANEMLKLGTTDEGPWSKNKKKKFRMMRHQLQSQEDVKVGKEEETEPKVTNVSKSLKSDNLSLDDLKSRLASSRFRFINEKLYTAHSQAATKLFDEDPTSFQVYHEGYQLQIAKWPIKPIERAVQYVLRRPKSDVVVDMGCGEAVLAESVPHNVKSFDLRAINDRVTVADMANIPLESGTADVVVCCLSLMGTNLVDFIKEAHRLLKPGGVLWIAEVVSRFEGDIVPFCEGVESVGFTMFNQDTSCSTHFLMLYFRKNVETMEEKKKKLKAKKKSKAVKEITLAPCLYKRR